MSDALPAVMGRDPKQRWFQIDSKGESVAMYQVGNRLYAMKTVKQCNTCQSPYRSDIEMALIKGTSYRKIEEALPEGAKVGFRSIGNHYSRGHMPHDEMYRRLLVEERARELGLDTESQEMVIHDQILFARAVVSQGYMDLMEGNLKVSASDALAAANFLHKVEQLAGGQSVNLEAAIRLLRIYYDEIRAVVPPDMMAIIARRIEANPELAEARAQLEGRSEGDEEV